MTGIDAITSNTSGNANPPAIDHSYSRYDAKTGPDQGVGSMGFDDFLDMINPLEHIPLVSSIYRAVTGETINPLSRIAGDALYGGVFGLASAGIAAAGALSDEIFTASNDGKSASATVVAALFGDDKLGSDDEGTKLATTNNTPQIADAAPTLQKAGLLQTPARQSPILVMPDLSGTTQVASAQPTSSSTMQEAATIAMPAAGVTGTGMPLDRGKLAYGGVMDTAMVQNAVQNQSLALALVSGQDNLQAQHALRNNRFSTNTASTVTSPTAQSAALSLPGDATSVSMSNATSAATAPAKQIAAAQASAAPGNAAIAAAQSTAIPASVLQSLPPSLRQSLSQNAAAEIRATKGLDQYRSTAQKVPAIGASVDMSN
jgi:hypothetical protein